MFNQSPKQIVPINRWPLFIGIVVLILVIGMFMYKSQVSHHVKMVEHKPSQSINVSNRGMENSWFNEDKFKDMKMDIVLPSEKIKYQEEHTETISKEDQALEFEEKKLELEAQKSPLSIEVSPVPGTEPVFKSKQDGKDPLTDRLNDVMDMVKAATGNKLPEVEQDIKKVFLQKNGSNDDYLEHAKQNPRSPYEVKAGTYIPAALVTGINSDLPGNVNAQVTENIYDSVTGNYLLIPQGAKLVGEYNSNLTFGQQRVQVVWDRIIFPDGQSLDLEKMQGVDISGYTGLHDKVDNHYLRIYGNAILLSLMGAGYDILNQNNQQQLSESPQQIIAANVGQKLSDVGSQALEKNMNTAPTIIIQPGYKFKVIVMKDMVLEKLQDVEGTLSYAN